VCRVSCAFSSASFPSANIFSTRRESPHDPCAAVPVHGAWLRFLPRFLDLLAQPLHVAFGDRGRPCSLVQFNSAIDFVFQRFKSSAGTSADTSSTLFRTCALASENCLSVEAKYSVVCCGLCATFGAAAVVPYLFFTTETRRHGETNGLAKLILARCGPQLSSRRAAYPVSQALAEGKRTCWIRLWMLVKA